MGKPEDNKLKKEPNYEFYEHEKFVECLRENEIRKRILIIESIAIVLNIFYCILSTAYLAFIEVKLNSVFITNIINSFLDIINHIIVIWRYFKPKSLNSSTRDVRASILLAFVFFLSAFQIEYESIYNLVVRNKPDANIWIVFISLLLSLAFNSLSVYTFYLAHKVKHNSALISSGVNSLVSGLGNLSTAVNMCFLSVYPNVWYMDSVFGLICGIALFVYACQLLLQATCFAG